MNAERMVKFAHGGAPEVENRVILLINSIFVYRYETNSLKQKNIKLDSVDVQIVRQLRKNARLSNKALAAAVGLAQSSCLERVRRLRMARVLTGYHAEVERSEEHTSELQSRGHLV